MSSEKRGPQNKDSTWGGRSGGWGECSGNSSSGIGYNRGENNSVISGHSWGGNSRVITGHNRGESNSVINGQSWGGNNNVIREHNRGGGEILPPGNSWGARSSFTSGHFPASGQSLNSGNSGTVQQAGAGWQGSGQRARKNKKVNNCII